MRRAFFLSGLFLLCLSVLVLQIALTRVLSVMAFFHVAFFSISMAMLGLTAGAVWVYLRGITAEQMAIRLPQICFWYGLAAAATAPLLASTYIPLTQNLTQLASLLKVIFICAAPFCLAGVAVSLCLTRGPGKVGLRYAVDLCGAALGCLLCLPLLNALPGPSVLLCAGGLGLGAALIFHLQAPPQPGLTASRIVIALLAILCLAHLGTWPRAGFSILPIKSRDMLMYGQDFDRWNTFSQVAVTWEATAPPFYWGAGPHAPRPPQLQRYLTIDASAATPMIHFTGDYGSLGFLDHDVTTFAYVLRNTGTSAVIGVGGGRDILSARRAGFRDVTAVELNPIMVDLLTKPDGLADFAGIGKDPHVHFYVDDGRSWFARTTEKFDLIQMSMVDTWAATGAGNFTLSENGLYTMEGWAHFLNALTPTGVFTVSRWHGRHNLDETGRVVALAKAALFNLGVQDPNRHIYLVGTPVLATLLLSRSPLTPEEIVRLDAAAQARGFDVLLRPGMRPHTPVLSGLMAATTLHDLQTFASRQALDVSAPSDASPFFFNQLKPHSFLSPDLWPAIESRGVLAGNLKALSTLALIILLSAFAVVCVLLTPAHASVRKVPRGYALAGTAWFMLIGLGFMLVEVGTIQRMSLFLGHPVYGLAIVLFSLILFTGIGSFFSDYMRLDKTPLRLAAWALLLAAVLLGTNLLAPSLLAAHEGDGIVHRACLAIALIVPAALLMGFGFPTGMAMAERIDPAPMPWFWAINGAAGVLGSGLAVLTSLIFSIPTTIAFGALCYALLVVPGANLQRKAWHTRGPSSIAHA